MCGICFACGFNIPEEELHQLVEFSKPLLEARGPDIMGSLTKNITKQMNSIFMGYTLWLQGDEVMKQPVEDEFGNILLWNGDILSGYNVPEDECDTKFIADHLAQKELADIIKFIQHIKGPWAIIYYQNSTKKLYFGRDVLGRHSLVWKLPDEKSSSFLLSSVVAKVDDAEEVPALGLYYIDFNLNTFGNDYDINLIPWDSISLSEFSSNLNSHIHIEHYSIKSPIVNKLNMSEPTSDMIEQLRTYSTTLVGDDLSSDYLQNEININKLTDLLTQSIQRRIDKCPQKCINCTRLTTVCDHTKYAVLFSGGLDSAMIALILDSCVSPDESIDLLNVAFEQRRSVNTTSQRKNRSRSTVDTEEFASSYDVPDRLSGRQCWKDLCQLRPNRTWNFVEIDVTPEELKEQRDHLIKYLVAPLASVLDDSIGCAFWFGGLGKGEFAGQQYKSSARVLLCGMGADEQLAGYSRHRSRFNSDGWPALINEIHMEMSRIYKRNLGRDNRILAHHGRAPRFPFLDEDLVAFLNTLSIYEKANLYLPRGIGEKLLLRIAAAHLGLYMAASLPKRAIQFGTRIAKLENGKEKGSDVCQRL